MKLHHSLFMAALAVVLAAPAGQAQLLYEQTFNPPNNPDGYTGAIEDAGWSVKLFPSGGFSGVFENDFDPAGFRDAANDQLLPGNTGLFIGVGSPSVGAGGTGIDGELGAFYVTEGAGGFEPIDPADCPRLLLNVYANTQNGGGDDSGYFIVQLGDPDPRNRNNAWYIASSPMDAPNTDAQADGGGLFAFRSLEFDPAAGNWNLLSDPTSTDPLSIMGAAGDLSNLIITGVGVVQSITNPPPLDDFSNPDAFSSWNYSYYHITCVPEPTAMVLLAVAAPIGLAIRRRRK